MLTWNMILLIEETFSFPFKFFMVNIGDSDNPSEQQQKTPMLFLFFLLLCFFFFLDYDGFFLVGLVCF